MIGTRNAVRLVAALCAALVMPGCDSSNEGDAAKGDVAAKGDAAEGDAAKGKAEANEGKAGDAKAPDADAEPFTFEVTATNGMTWTHDSPGAKVKKAKGDYFQVKATSFSLRIMANEIADAGPAKSTDLDFNNTFLHFRTEIGGKAMMIGCHPDRDAVKGMLDRTKLDDDVIEGSFELELVQCNDYMTGKPVEYEGVPFTAKGTFSLPVTG